MAQIRAGGGFSVDIEAEMMADIAGAVEAPATVDPVEEVGTEGGTEDAGEEETGSEGGEDAGQDTDEGSDEDAAADDDAESEGEDEEASDDEDGDADGEDEEDKDSDVPKSASAKRREAKKARFLAVQAEAESARQEAAKKTELLSEAAEIAQQVIDEGTRKDARIAQLESKLAELGHVESPEAKRLRQMEDEQAAAANSARFAGVRTQAQAAAQTAAVVARIKSEAAVAAVEHGVTAQEITNSLAEVMRNPASTVGTLLGITAQTPVAEIAAKLAAFKASRAPAKPKATSAKKQITKTQSAPKVRKAARTPPPADLGTGDDAYMAFLNGLSEGG